VALDPDIFKAYDIRGLYSSQIDGEAAEQIGRASSAAWPANRRTSCASHSGTTCA